MKLLYANPKFWQALFYDTLGNDDKAEAIMEMDTVPEKKAYWLNVAIFCAVVGGVGAAFTYGLSLLLLLVSARKMWMYATKKETKG